MKIPSATFGYSKILSFKMNLQYFLGFGRQSHAFYSIKHIKNGEYREVISSDSSKSADGKTNGGDPSSINRETVSVALIGGGITPAYTALLLKQIPIIKFVYVADVNDNAAGLMLDASYVDTSTKIRYFNKNNVSSALREADIIALMDENDFNFGKASSEAQFLASSRYVKTMAEKMIRSCPAALVAVFAHPVTATLPLVSEIYKSMGCWDPNRVVGSLAIDSMRIRASVAHLFGLNPAYTSIPIVGGADACTVVPLLSQAKPVNQFSKEQRNSLIQALRASDNELASINEYARGAGGPRLSMAAAATKFIITLAGGYCGFKNAIASAFVRSNVLPVCRYFGTELEFGPEGVKKNFGLPKVSEFEIELIEQSIPIINANVDLALDMMRKKNKTKSKI